MLIFLKLIVFPIDKIQFLKTFFNKNINVQRNKHIASKCDPVSLVEISCENVQLSIS